ncbi:putative bifunctional diguanylate cyclase/phosphodiesterase [Thiomicrospira microaerophila]|uniref:putative bifunctional diguanylate cyclase/phosphodiesterase n=1 Tax=Thiomicrospira microaerophila TaxID=406020 RepID=UPI000697B508|nr:bifunctional diguanylate cyclase/phosphodiesterase [Thiomicrospira microaerophila]
MKKTRSIKNLIMLGAIVASFTLFGLSYLVASTIFERVLTQNAQKGAVTLSQLTFDKMYEVMSQGWNREQLNAFLEESQQAYQRSEIKLDIFRSQLITEVYGEIEQPNYTSVAHWVQPVFETGQAVTHARGDQRINLFPLNAEARCLSCHANAKVGDTLGVMLIEQDLSAEINEAKSQFFWFFLMLLPLPLLMAYVIGLKLNAVLQQAIGKLHDQVVSIQKVRDLRQIKNDHVISEYKEFQQLGEEFQALAEKLQTVAVDRDILEFEIQLLDKFIITSDVVKDWKEHISYLINEMTKILPMYALFVVFRTDNEERFAMEIFWAGHPTPSMKQRFENAARAQIHNHPILKLDPTIDIHHSITNEGRQLEENLESFELQTKSLMLETPKIGGVVGLGVQSLIDQDLTRTMVIESILTTLINVVGSIKAINKYTHELEYYATRDPLTNLLNQRVFNELLEYEMGRAVRKDYKFSLMVLDFDNFKNINDRFGHAFGDLMLQTFANRVHDVLRAGDMFGRYGGDEFVILLPETNTEQASHVADLVMQTVHKIEETANSGQKVHIACSIGIACYPDHASSSKELFVVADNMMYKSKHIGKDQISMPTEDELHDLFNRNIEKTSFLLDVLENEDWIEAHFQPILGVAGAAPELSIHELLMRIRHNGELVSAYQFIDIAESMGIIAKLDYILIKQAFKQMQETGYRGLLFINLSPKAMILNEFINKVKDLAQEFQIAPDRIVFELTERETVSNIALLEKFVRDLKFEGFRFAIDDFGSGFSSFHYLKHFPIDYLKIEGEFISNMLKDPIDLAFVKSAVTLAQSIGILTVAEFIEDAPTLQAVKDLGIDYAQGYFVQRPEPRFLTEVPEQVRFLKSE